MIRNITILTIAVVICLNLVHCARLQSVSKRTFFEPSPDDKVNDGVASSLSNIMPPNSFLSMIFPMLAKFLIAPFKSLAKMISQFFLFVAVGAYLFSSFIPSLAGVGSAAVAVRNIKRSFSLPSFLAAPLSSAASRVSELADSLNLPEYVNTGLDLLNLRSDDCRTVVACRLGSSMAREQPSVSKYVMSIAHGLQIPMDNGTSVMMEAMNETIHSSARNASVNDVCDPLMSQCGSIERVEKFWHALTGPDNDGSLVNRLMQAINPNQTADSVGEVAFDLLRKMLS